MNKAEIINAIAKHADISKKQAKEIFELIFTKIETALKKEKKLQFLHLEHSQLKKDQQELVEILKQEQQLKFRLDQLLHINLQLFKKKNFHNNLKQN